MSVWRSFHWQVAGRGHLMTSTPCQDRTYSLSSNGVKALALADGAGSAKLSHFGADSTTRSICNYVSENFDSIFSNNDGIAVKSELLAVMLISLDELVAKNRCELKDLAATLLFVAIKDNDFLIAHVGDGVIGYVQENEIKVVSAPDNGEFANSTVFVTSSNALSSMRLYKGSLDEITGFVLMSDGTAASFYNHNAQTLVPALAGLIEKVGANSTKKFKRNLRRAIKTLVRSKTSDDCSLAILARKPETSILAQDTTQRVMTSSR